MTTQQTATQQQAEEKIDRADRAVLRQILAGGGSLIVLEAIKQVIAERAMAGELSKIASLTRLKDELFGKAEKPKKPATNGAAATPATQTTPAAAKKSKKAEQLSLPKAEDEEVEEEEIDEPSDDEDEDEPAEASDDDEGASDDEDDEEETPPPAIKPARVGKMKGKKGRRG